MPIFEPGDVVKVPFPYTDKATRQRRPALVITAGPLQLDHSVLWVLMITSAKNRGWTGDVSVSALAKAGLPVPSVIRTAKIATIEARDAEPLGKLGRANLSAVRLCLRQMLER